MKITLISSLKNVGISLILIIASVIVSILVTEYIRYYTRDELRALNPPSISVDVSKLPEMPITKIEKTSTPAIMSNEAPENFLPPVREDAPVPFDSKKSNNPLDNLLFAMSFYYHVPLENEMDASVAGWDPDTGYYALDNALQEMMLSRNVRYLLILTIYQQMYPTNRFFDDEAARMKDIVQHQVTIENLDIVFNEDMIIQFRVPLNLFYDLLELSELTGEEIYRESALKIGGIISNYARAQAALIKNNRDRTDKVSMFGHAAVAYIMGRETGDINLSGDSQLLMRSLVEQLWADKFNLIYTNATTGQLSNITETFITTEQMGALTQIVKYADASGDTELADKVHQVLRTMIDGTNPLCDRVRDGFFRRYNGKSQTPHTDYKFAEDHIRYLEAWIRLNMMKKGEYGITLDMEYENYEWLLYNEPTNGIYLSYEVDWRPRAEQTGKPLISTDAILDFLLITLEDRRFVSEKGTETAEG